MPKLSTLTRTVYSSQTNQSCTSASLQRPTRCLSGVPRPTRSPHKSNFACPGMRPVLEHLTRVLTGLRSFGSPSRRGSSSRTRDAPLPSPSCLRSHDQCFESLSDGSPPTPKLVRRDTSDPGTRARELAVTRAGDGSPSNRIRSSSASAAEVPIVVVPLRSCCGECFSSVDKALETSYEEKWTRGARRRRRYGLNTCDIPVGAGRVSVELLRVDELPTPSAETPCTLTVSTPTSAGGILAQQETEDDCYLFPLPCHRKRRARVSGDSDASGSSTPTSSAEDAPPLPCVSPIGTPALTPTSELDDPLLASPPHRPTIASLPPLRIPVEIPADPNDPDPDAIPQQFIAAKEARSASISPVNRRSASTSPVRQRLLSAGSILRGAVSAAAAPSGMRRTGAF